MRVTMEQPTLFNDRKDLARHPLDLPIVRTPISLQSTTPIQTSSGQTALKGSLSPITPGSPTTSALSTTTRTTHVRGLGPIKTAQAQLSGRREMGLHLSPPPRTIMSADATVRAHPTGTAPPPSSPPSSAWSSSTCAAPSSSSGPTARPRPFSYPHSLTSTPATAPLPIKISAPRQSRLSTLNLDLPEISAQLSEPCPSSSSSTGSSNSSSSNVAYSPARSDSDSDSDSISKRASNHHRRRYPKTNFTTTTAGFSYLDPYPPSAANDPLRTSSSRRASWSPSKAIPEGHYSKGFTLTSSQKNPISLTSAASSTTTASSSTLPVPAPAASSALKRSNTNHSQRRASLTPFQRLVDRSKSMKIKTLGPFGVSSSEIDNSNNSNTSALRTERFAAFYNEEHHRPQQEHRRAQKNSKIMNNTMDLYDTKPTMTTIPATTTTTTTTMTSDIKLRGDRNTLMWEMDNGPTRHTNSIQTQTRGAVISTSTTKSNRSTTGVSSIIQGSLTHSTPEQVLTADNPMAALAVPLPPTQAPLTAIAGTEDSLSSAGSKPSISIAPMSNVPYKPLWQHTMTTAEEIQELGLSPQDIQKQETIFELIYTESEYLDDLKNIHKIFVEELNVRMAESRKKKRFSPDKADVRLYERLARLLSHIKDLWNGHQSLLRSLQNKQQQESPVVKDIGSVFESFYMFSIYDSYFAQYATTSRDFHLITSGTSELSLIMKDLLKSPRCKCLTLEGIFLKPIQRLQKYPLFFKDLMNLTPKTDPDYVQLKQALDNHQRELTKIDDRIWIEEHNEMLMDLQQRIKGLPSNFSLVDRHRYLILDGPVHRITVRQPSKFPLGKHGKNSKSESYVSSSQQHQSQHHRQHSHLHGLSEWRGDSFQSPVGTDFEDDHPTTLLHRPRQLDYHHLHTKPAFLGTPPTSSSSSTSSGSSTLSTTHAGLTAPSSPFPNMPASKIKSRVDPVYESPRNRSGSDVFYSSSTPSSPPVSTSTLHTLSSVSSPIPIPKSSASTTLASSPTSFSVPLSKQSTVSQLVSQYNFNFSSSFSSLAGVGSGNPRNISSSALYLPGIIKNSTDVEAEYHVFIFTDIVLWTKRVMSRYHRKEGAPWNFKLVEPISKLTSVRTTSEENIFMCTSVNTSSSTYLVRTEDEVAARMWRTTIPTLVPFHCSRNIKDRSGKK